MYSVRVYTLRACRFWVACMHPGMNAHKSRTHRSLYNVTACLLVHIPLHCGYVLACMQASTCVCRSMRMPACGVHACMQFKPVQCTHGDLSPGAHARVKDWRDSAHPSCDCHQVNQARQRRVSEAFEPHPQKPLIRTSLRLSPLMHTVEGLCIIAGVYVHMHASLITCYA